MDKIKTFKIFDSFTLRVIAMVSMLLDHMWATVITGNAWMTYAGRLAYPIFAFLLVEGFFHTSNLKKYLVRLGIFAIISEIPFNLIMGGSIIYPFHQNVIVTFLIGLITMYIIEKSKSIENKFLATIGVIATCIFSFIFATITLADYFGYGILIILVFYFAHGLKYGWIIELVGMIYVNYILMGGQVIPMFGGVFEFPTQAFALLSLIFIWLYNGKRGINSKIARYSFYIFYPLHMLILYFIAVAIR
ncbi:MAG: TraX family protein [Oscillospiraceae bacterium]